MASVLHFLSVLTSSGPRTDAMWVASIGALGFFAWLMHDKEDQGT